MNTLDTYTCTDSWGLVYDAAASGDFIGTIQEITGYRSLCYIGSGIPGNDNAGFVLSGGFLQISVNAANKLYAKRYPGDPYSMPKLSLAMANITVVGGAAAVGSAPTANPVGVSGVDGSGLKRAIRTDADGRGEGTVPAPVRITRVFSALNDVQTLPVQSWMNSVSIEITTPSASFSGSLTLGYSPNSTNGTDGDWFALNGRNPTLGTVPNTTIFSGAQALRADIPVSATFVRALCTAYTTGPFSAVISAGSDGTSGVFAISAPLIAGANRIGFMARPGVWTRESTTPVNAGQTISGAAKTTFNTASGVALNSATSYGDRFAAAAGSDVAGTLVIYDSPDNGTTLYPIASVALAQVGGTGNFAAYLETPITEATMLAKLINGPTNQTRAFLTTRMLG